MARRNNQPSTEPTPSAQDAAPAPDQVVEPGEDQATEQLAGKVCPTCEGRGIRPEISEHELCPDCHGSGTLEASDDDASADSSEQ